MIERVRERELKRGRDREKEKIGHENQASKAISMTYPPKNFADAIYYFAYYPSHIIPAVGMEFDDIGLK